LGKRTIGGHKGIAGGEKSRASLRIKISWGSGKVEARRVHLKLERTGFKKKGLRCGWNREMCERRVADKRLGGGRRGLLKTEGGELTWSFTIDGIKMFRFK